MQQNFYSVANCKYEKEVKFSTSDGGLTLRTHSLLACVDALIAVRDKNRKAKI